MNLTAQDLAAKHNLKRIGREWRGACPACGYNNGLTLSEKRGRVLWRCMSCGDQAAVGAALLGDAAPVRSAPAETHEAGEDRRAAALRLWELAMPAAGTPVENYLRGRGLALPKSAASIIRYLPEAKHPNNSRLPCMVASLVDIDGRPAAIHRTFLAPGGAGKAKVEPQRMTLGPVRGAAVRLSPAAGRLVVGEGIETSLAAGIILNLPAWAAVSAGNMGDSLRLPPDVREIVIAADNDAPGRDAARRAAARWRAEGRAVRIAMPDREGADFADVLANRVRHG